MRTRPALRPFDFKPSSLTDSLGEAGQDHDRPTVSSHQVNRHDHAAKQSFKSNLWLNVPTSSYLNVNHKLLSRPSFLFPWFSKHSEPD